MPLARHQDEFYGTLRRAFHCPLRVLASAYFVKVSLTLSVSASVRLTFLRLVAGTLDGLGGGETHFRNDQ